MPENPDWHSPPDGSSDFLLYHRELSNRGVMVPEAISQTMGWKGLQAARYRNVPAKELRVPRLSHHVLILVTKAPNEMEVTCEGFKRDRPPPTGSITLFPAGSVRDWHWRGTVDSLQIALDPKLLGKVAAESFGIELSTSIEPLNSFTQPQLRNTMLGVQSELIPGRIAGSLMIESLANILAVQLIRHVFGIRQRTPRVVVPLSQRELSMVIDYMMANLNDSPTLEQMAALIHRSPYHFAHQFKATTGLPPHQYLITRRIERAQEMLRQRGNANLGEIAIAVGFNDQSQFSSHFKRIVGVTPGQFRALVRSA